MWRNKEHKKEECKAYGQTCHLCLKLNHFASVCRFTNKPAGGKTVHQGRNSMKRFTEAVFNLEIMESGSSVPRDILNWVISKMVWVKLL